jgi:hypothetical protein
MILQVLTGDKTMRTTLILLDPYSQQPFGLKTFLPPQVYGTLLMTPPVRFALP